jgi:hypothetical protein
MRLRLVFVALAAGPLLAACSPGGAGTGSSGGGGSGSASCAAGIEYDGHDYSGYAAEVAPSDLGEQLGAARIPPCNDTNGASEDGEAVVAVRIKGVPPEVAVAVTYSNSTIFIREGTSFESLPEQVKRLLPAGRSSGG